MSPQGASEQWMPNGFPPPSFVVETERTRTFMGPRGRWLAAAGILGALLLIAGLVLIANQGDDDKTALDAGPTTTVFGDPSPTFPSSTALDPTATLPNATVPPGGVPDPGVTTPGGTGTTAAPGSTAAPGPTAPPGVLTPSAGSVSIPKVDSTAGPQQGRVTLRNTGGSPLDYATRSNFGGLTVDKPTGNIAPGAATDLLITLNGAGAREGAFSGTLSFDAAGSSQTVTVNSTVGRPPSISDTAGEPCPTETPTCSKQIKLENTLNSAPTLCNTPWRYRVAIGDESPLKFVRADIASGDVELKINGAPNGPGGVWQSEVQQPLKGTLTFTIEASDQLDFTRRSTPRTVTCPA